MNDSDDENDESEDKRSSSTFALELAYIVEHYCDQSVEEAVAILDLLLKGAKSIMLGVSYAQRHRQYSSTLWDRLINHCLSSRSETVLVGSRDGMLFGSLLEAAALSGADVARLVTKIPPGMVVEGLRPRLVAAVADYRLKVDIHQAASAAANEEQVGLIREVAHRSRRGVRFIFPQKDPAIIQEVHYKISVETKKDKETSEQSSVLAKSLRPIGRRDRHYFSISLPVR